MKRRSKYIVQVLPNGVGQEWLDFCFAHTEGSAVLIAKLLRDHATAVKCRHAYRVEMPDKSIAILYTHGVPS